MNTSKLVVVLAALSSASFFVGRAATASETVPSDLLTFKQQVRAGLDKTLCRCLDAPPSPGTSVSSNADPYQGEAYRGVGFVNVTLEAAAGTTQSKKRFVSVSSATPPICVVPAFDYASGAESTLRRLPAPVKCTKFEIIGFAPGAK